MLTRRDLNPGDLFYYTTPSERSTIPLDQLRYVPKGASWSGPPADLGAVRSPEKPDYYIGQKGLERGVRLVTEQEVRSAQKKHVTADQIYLAMGMCAIAAVRGSSWFAGITEMFGEDVSSRTAGLARCSFWAQPEYQGGGPADEGWRRAAEQLLKGQLPPGWVKSAG